LRDVQHALAREHGFDGWSGLKDAVASRDDEGQRGASLYETKADALLDAYRTGTPEAMERHYRHTWHRRAWPAMRRYVQLDLGKRPREKSMTSTSPSTTRAISSRSSTGSTIGMR
jgi:hypothetical protein